MKIGPVYINILSSKKPFEIALEFNKKTYYLKHDKVVSLLSELKSVLNTSDKHFNRIKEYILKSLDIQ